MPPSVPPDMTRQMRSASPAGRWRRNSRLNASVAWPREKSLTRPLPSVLASTATTPLGSIRPAAMAASMPLTSSGAEAEMRWTRARRGMDGDLWGSCAIERPAIMRPQRRAQLGHGGADVGCRVRRLAQSREQLGLERRQIDAGDDAVAHDLTAGDEQLLHVLLPRLGEQQLERRHVRLDE